MTDRDPDRILTMTNNLHKLWSMSPYLRLGQLIANLCRDDKGRTDLQRIFYIEDDELLRIIRAAIEEGM